MRPRWRWPSCTAPEWPTLQAGMPLCQTLACCSLRSSVTPTAWVALTSHYQKAILLQHSLELSKCPACTKGVNPADIALHESLSTSSQRTHLSGSGTMKSAATHVTTSNVSSCSAERSMASATANLQSRAAVSKMLC